MRDIHPSYLEATITCACGNAVKTRTTRGAFTVDVCGACHPFYTGKQKLMDTAGRVDRFRKKFGDSKASDRAKGGPVKGSTTPKKEKPEGTAEAETPAATE